MSFLFFIRKNIAVGQKSKADPGRYGQGFNYQVEAGFDGGEQAEKCEEILIRVLKNLDHRLLGIDSEAVADPTTANICRWIFDELRKSNGRGAREVRLLRGDGLIAVSRCS